MNVYFSKLYVFILLILFRLIFGFCPLLISRKVKRKHEPENINKLWVEKSVLYSMDFSGGVLLATCFIHMIPEVRQHLLEIDDLKEKFQFPLAETLVCIGFFLVYGVEEFMKYMLSKKSTKSLLKQSETLMCSKLNETVSVADESTRNGEIQEKDTNAASADSSGEGTNNGIVLPVAATNNGLISELNSIIRDETAENNNNTTTTPNLKNFLLISALSFHSVMEGLAIGLAQDTEDVWYLFLAVSLHECIILLCIGIEMTVNCPSVSSIIIYMIVFALVSPAGVLFGTLATLNVSESESSTQLLIITSLQGLAAGTILYVTFFEVLTAHKHHHQDHHFHHNHYHRTKSSQSTSSLLKFIFICSGFIFMVILEIIGSHNHSHRHLHHHASEHLSNNKSSY